MKVTTRTLKKAQRAAMAGETGAAIEQFDAMLQAGSASAAASRAELAAFQGDWATVVPCAAMLIADPGAVYAGNVFDAMVQLLGRAGHQGQSWESIRLAAQEGFAKAQTQEREHLKKRYATISQNLADYADREGQAPHELVHVFGPAQEPPNQESPNPAAYFEAAKEATTLRPDLTGKPDDLAVHRLALAVSYQLPEEIVRQFFERPAAMDFQNACNAARALVTLGKSEQAWPILEVRLPLWWPVDLSQVTPVELICDPDLRTLLTPERCAQVLSTPRGPSV